MMGSNHGLCVPSYPRPLSLLFCTRGAVNRHGPESYEYAYTPSQVMEQPMVS